MAYHSPGPWKRVDHNWEYTSIFPVADPRHPICTLSLPETGSDEIDSAAVTAMNGNARLDAIAKHLESVVVEAIGKE